MRLAVTLLLAALISFSSSTQAQNRREDDGSPVLQSPEDDGMTLDSLIEEGNEDTSTFGAELLQELHLHALECKMNISKLEHHYQNRISKLIKYYRDLEKLVSVPKFDKFNNENRQDIESNFHNTMRETEREQREKLERAQELCDTEQREWLEDKLAAAVSLAKKLITQNSVQYRELINKVGSFRSKISAHMTTCRRGNARKYRSVTCATDELEQLINFTGAFIDTMKQIEILYYGDDEDFEREGNSFGSGTETPKMEEELDNEIMDDSTPLTTETKVPFNRAVTTPPAIEVVHHKTIILPPDFFLPGPTLINPKEDKPSTPQTTPTKSDSSSTFRETTSTNLDEQVRSTPQEKMLLKAMSKVEVSSLSHETVTERSQSTPTGITEVSTFRSQQPTNANLPPSTAVHTEVDALSENFDGVQADGELRSSSVSASASSASRHLPTFTSPHPYVPSLDIIDKDKQNIAAEASQTAYDNVIIIDGPEQSLKKQDVQSHNYYQLLLPFVVIVVIILIIAVTLVVVLTALIVKKKRTEDKKVLLTSENNTLETMKKTGYVNPTYKFYTRC